MKNKIKSLGLVSATLLSVAFYQQQAPLGAVGVVALQLLIHPLQRV
ncbi:MAG: hypothetical protein IPJ69_12265 [Deltaproteobacteria bacterium]|nr:MAG: hypothetical protein IPJ69_12265 [Deltaproteobacteria bacterium]